MSDNMLPPNNPLGKNSIYKSQYDHSLLFPIKRESARKKMNIDDSLFQGFDIWNCFEVSWLNIKGKPEVRIMRIIYPANSPCIVESKSLKLYLNSFNMTIFENESDVIETVKQDLDNVLGTNTQVMLHGCNSECFKHIIIDENILIDNLDVKIDTYAPDNSLLSLSEGDLQEREFYSNLLKTNCPVTGQPDWGSVYIKYLSDRKISEASLLKYIISYRNAQDFHEACCEKIFSDIYETTAPDKLFVRCFYTRRGGIDINPVRFAGYNAEDIDFSLCAFRQ